MAGHGGWGGGGGGYPPPGPYGPPGGANPGGGGQWGGAPAGGWAGPPPGMPPGYQPTGGTAPLEGGVPWERHDMGLLGRWWATVKAVNFDGRAFFAAAKQSNDVVSACVFNTVSATILGFAIGLGMLLMMVVFGGVFVATGIAQKVPEMGAAVAGMGIGFGLLYMVLLVASSAAGGFIGPWVQGGIHHLLLMLFGAVAQDKGYEHTVRAYAFAMGAATPWLLIPIPLINALVMGVFAFINLITGYDETHNAGTGKVVMALLAPALCCCSCYAMIFLMGAIAR